MSLMPQELHLAAARAHVLAQVAGDHLSSFEQDLIAQVERRRAAFGAAAQVTDAEAAVLLDSLAAMENGLRRTFADNKEAFCGRLVVIRPILEEALRSLSEPISDPGLSAFERLERL